MTDFERELRAIHDRNRRVELDKAWERSFTRRGFIALITYLTATIFLWIVGVGSPFVHALVPTGGYLLSTLSLPWVKGWWLQKAHRQRKS
jgi:hypothetical protein